MNMRREDTDTMSYAKALLLRHIGHVVVAIFLLGGVWVMLKADHEKIQEIEPLKTRITIVEVKQDMILDGIKRIEKKVEGE